MSDIDPEKLERAIAQACNHGPMQGGLAGGTFTSTPTHVLYTLIAAARAHLATLPRWKEMEREYYEVTDIYGNAHGVYPSLGSAESIARLHAGRVVVRLTGTAKVKVTP